MAKSKYTFAEVESALDKAIKTNPIVAYENKKVKITSGKVLTNNGSFSSFTKGGCTTTDNFIYVSEGETLEVISGGIWGGIESGVVPIVAGWYDADKNFVSVALQNKNYTNGIEIVVPSGVSYLAVSYWNGIETKVRKKTTPTVEKDDTKYKNIAVERMKREQQIQHKYIKPYYDYSRLSSGILTFGQDDLVADFADIAQCFIEADVPMFCAYCENANFSFHNVDETFWGKSSVTVREVINKVVENGGEVMAHHGKQMTQAMLEDFDTCYEHFVEVKKYIEDEGYECNGIITAGGIGQVLGSPLSDMWVRSNFLYADLYGEESYAEPYYHRRGALLHAKGKLDELKAEITTSMSNKKWCVYYLHNFSELTKDELVELLAWVKEQGYATKTYKEVYDELIAYDIVGVSGSSSTPDMSNYYTKAEINTLLSGGTLPKTLSSINATKTTTSYNVGDTIDVSDITVTATYSDGTNNTVTGFTTNVSSLSTATSGSKTLTVSYTEGDITKTSDIAITVSGSDDNWDEEVTLNGAWSSATPSSMRYTTNASKSYTITFTAMATTDVNGVKFQLATNNKTVNFVANEPQDITIDSTTNTTGENNATITATGAGTYPTTIKIKNFSCTEVTE